MANKLQYIMYDGRARTQDTENATILDMADDLEEVKEANKAHKGEDYIWFEYTDNNGLLENEKMRPDL